MGKSEVVYHEELGYEDSITVYWGEWTYYFNYSPTGWSIKVSAWTTADYHFLSDPLGR